MPNPLLGVFFHATGGFAAGSFYLPIKKIKSWSWESAWLINGLFAWLFVPILVSFLTVPETWIILKNTPLNTLFWTYFFGVLWGMGGLSFGLAMRYLGISLGMALALGLTAAFGTLVPPLYMGEFGELVHSPSGQIVLIGIAISFIGIAVCGRAGFLRDQGRKKSESTEFSLIKGVVVAFFAGIMSSCFAFGIIAGKPITDIALSYGTTPLWQNSPVFIIILLGGLSVNLIWCASLNLKNKTYRDYTSNKTPLKRNYLFAALAGTTWYCQFMFYGMGSTQMGKLDFASWTLHMVFIIIFSTFWGIVTKEWDNTRPKTKLNLSIGLAILVISTIVIGLSNQITSH